MNLFVILSYFAILLYRCHKMILKTYKLDTVYDLLINLVKQLEQLLTYRLTAKMYNN